MFSLMGNCVSCIKKRREPKTPVTLAILGLDSAGKTTTTLSLTGEPLDEDVTPTVGFNSEKFVMGKFEVTMFDLGGGKHIRAIWTTYLPEVYGIVYMVDSTAAERMEEMKTNFRELVENPKVAGKPILVLANKQDKETALDEVDIMEQLQLEDVVNANMCPCRVECCSAVKGTGRKMDSVIKEGMQWLCDVIDKNYNTLKPRVDQDIADAEKKREIEAVARKERVKKIREERKRQEEEERKRLGIEKEDSEEEDVIDGNPFKPVNVEELTKKEAKMKQEKKKLKELKAKADQESTMTKIDDGEEMDSLKTPKSNKMYGLSRLSVDNDEKSAEDSDEIVSSSRSRRMLPPMQAPLGTKFVEEATQKKKKHKVKQKGAYSEETIGIGNVENTDEADLSMAGSHGQKSLRTLSKIEVTTKSLGESDGSVPSPRHGLTPLDRNDNNLNTVRKKKKHRIEENENMNNNIFELQDVSTLVPTPRPLPRLSPLASETKVKKMKKKKSKKNHISPAEYAGQVPDDLDMTPQARGDYSRKNYPWDTPNQLLDGSDTDETDVKRHTEDFSTKWGLAEDLPDIAQPAIRTRPNYDDDDDIVL